MAVERDGAGRFDAAPQQLVMTLLGAYVQPRETRTVWAGGLVRLLSDLGFSAGAARIALSRLVRSRLLSRNKRGRHVYYSLTSRALRLLDEGDRRIFTLGRTQYSAGRWTVLWHSIPEQRRQARDALVRRLRFLGFGSIQDGTWIAPRDAGEEVIALLDELGVREYTGLMHAHPAGIADVRTFVARAWDVDALDKAYTAFVAEFAHAVATDDRSAFLLRTRLVHTFRRFPFDDPELPEDLVDPPEMRAEAVRLFHARYTALAPAAQRYFDEATRP